MDDINIRYEDQDWIEGKVNLPGIRRDVYRIAKRNIVGWPTLPDDYVNELGEKVTYVGNFILAPLAKWDLVSCIVDKSPVDGKSQGTKPSKTFLNSFTLQHQSVDEDASAQAMQGNNDDFVYLVRTKTGKWRVIGNEMYQTDTSYDQKLGGAPTDEMGTTMTITVTDLAPGLFYPGEIVTRKGIINESTDKVAEVTFTPDGGTVVAGTDTIALESATAGSTIKYSVDGGAWLIYGAPISTVGWPVGDHVIAAKATKAGMSDSIETIGTFHV